MALRDSERVTEINERADFLEDKNIYRIDDIGFGGLKLKQCPEEFCYGTDAVLLADAASKATGSRNFRRIMDMGTGTGIIPLILSAKTKAEFIGGIEVQKHSFDLAKENISMNRLDGRVAAYNDNVKDFLVNHPEMAGSFDLVTSNPPYAKGSCAIESSNRAKAVARHEIEAELEDFLVLASKLLKDRGDFFMIHRPQRLVDICEGCRRVKLEPKELTFINGKVQDKPNIMIVHCVKNGKRELKFNDILTLRNEDGSFTEAALEAYKL